VHLIKHQCHRLFR